MGSCSSWWSRWRRWRELLRSTQRMGARAETLHSMGMAGSRSGHVETGATGPTIPTRGAHRGAEVKEHTPWIDPIRAGGRRWGSVVRRRSGSRGQPHSTGPPSPEPPHATTPDTVTAAPTMTSEEPLSQSVICTRPGTQPPPTLPSQRPWVRTPNFAPDGPRRPAPTLVGTAVGTFLLARRKPGVQIPSPPPPTSQVRASPASSRRRSPHAGAARGPRTAPGRVPTSAGSGCRSWSTVRATLA